MNVKGLREVGRFIVEHPENFTMGGPDEIKEGSCGCIAVWACWLCGIECLTWGCYEREAEVILGLSHQEALELFHASRWPVGYGLLYAKMSGHRDQMARMATEVIEYTIRNRGGKP